jgi:hypothetical protein
MLGRLRPPLLFCICFFRCTFAEYYSRSRFDVRLSFFPTTSFCLISLLTSVHKEQTSSNDKDVFLLSYLSVSGLARPRRSTRSKGGVYFYSSLRDCVLIVWISWDLPHSQDDNDSKGCWLLGQNYEHNWPIHDRVASH